MVITTLAPWAGVVAAATRLAKIPILVVGLEALNDNIQSTIFCLSRRIRQGQAYSDSGIGVTAFCASVDCSRI